MATGPLGALSHDELGVIVDGLADPLQPDVAVALGSTCLGLRTPLGTALDVLRQRHERVKALLHKLRTRRLQIYNENNALPWRTMDVNFTCAELSDVDDLGELSDQDLNASDMVALGMILP